MPQRRLVAALAWGSPPRNTRKARADTDMSGDLEIQRCTASSRLIVTEGIHARFVEAVAERLNKLVIDHALKPGTDIGPVVDATQLEQDCAYIETARREGGNLRTGGDLLKRDTQGYYLSPALITDTTPNMRINREEVFGPVATLLPYRDLDHALALAHRGQGSLVTSLFGADEAALAAAAVQLRCAASRPRSAPLSARHL